MVFGESVIIILFVGTLCGKVNQKSKTFLRQVKGAKTVGKNAQFRKTVRSCAPLKIRFRSNFIEIFTPLVIMSFCIKLAVKLLLL